MWNKHNNPVSFAEGRGFFVADQFGKNIFADR
jgi:hypothetical protein